MMSYLLYAIFGNYAPYPQTHKFIDIFKSIKKEYQQNVYHKFKDYYCYYISNYTASVKYDSMRNIELLQFESFEGILNDMHDFTDFRYLSAGDGHL